MVSDLDVYLATPAAARPIVHQEQLRARESFADALCLGLPRDTFDEIREARDRAIRAAVARRKS